MKKYTTHYDTPTHRSQVLRNSAPKSERNLFVYEIGTNYINQNISQILIRNTCVIHFIYEGSLFFMDQLVEAGSFFVMFPDTVSHFQFVAGTPCATAWIQAEGEAALSELAHVGITPGKQIYSCPAANQISELIKTSIFADYEGHSVPYKLTSCFYDILSMYENSKNRNIPVKNLPSDQYVERATDFIKQKYYEDITPTDVAHFVNLNTNYLCRLFKIHTGISIKSYLIKYRIYIARILLKKTDMPIGEVADAVGYHDAMYFSQAFRDHTSYTPKDFRKKYPANTADDFDAFLKISLSRTPDI